MHSRGKYQKIIIPDLKKDCEVIMENFNSLEVHIFHEKYVEYLHKAANGDKNAKRNLCDQLKNFIRNNFPMPSGLSSYTIETLIDYFNSVNYICMCNSKSYNNMKDYCNTTDNTYKTISNNYVKFESDILIEFFKHSKETRKFTADNNCGAIFALLCKNVNKSPFLNSINEAYIEDDSSVIDRLNIEKYPQHYASFSYLRSYFNDLLALSEFSHEYIAEQLFGIRTTVYIVKRLYGIEKQYQKKMTCKEFYELMSLMLHIFMSPDIFGRKKHVDELLKKYSSWNNNVPKKNNSNIPSNDDVVILDYLIHYDESKEDGIDKFKNKMLSLNLTVLPFLRSVFALSESEKEPIENLMKIIGEYKTSHLIEQSFTDEEQNTALIDSLESSREKELFCMTYRFLRMRLFNREILDKWYDGLNVDFSHSRYLMQKILSTLMNERINIFTGNLGIGNNMGDLKPDILKAKKLCVNAMKKIEDLYLYFNT